MRAQVLFDARGGRPRPQLDDKVLTAWNGLMIAAFAREQRACWAARLSIRTDREDPGARHLAAATRAAAFVRDAMWDAERRVLRRRYRQGDAAIDGFAEDYAYLVLGVLELFQASGEPRWLQWARELQAGRTTCSAMPRTAAGSDDGQRSVGAGAGERGYDGAEPSPTSVSAMNC